MDSQISSRDIMELTIRVIRKLIERTNLDLKFLVKFIEIYNKACKTRNSGMNNDHDITNLDLREYVRNNLMAKGYIMVDPVDVDSVYLTQKAIDEYSY